MSPISSGLASLHVLDQKHRRAFGEQLETVGVEVERGAHRVRNLLARERSGHRGERNEKQGEVTHGPFLRYEFPVLQRVGVYDSGEGVAEDVGVVSVVLKRHSSSSK